MLVVEISNTNELQMGGEEEDVDEDNSDYEVRNLKKNLANLTSKLTVENGFLKLRYINIHRLLSGKKPENHFIDWFDRNNDHLLKVYLSAQSRTDTKNDDLFRSFFTHVPLQENSFFH